MEARYADVTLPSITLHEAMTARRTLLAKGRREVDTRAIIRTAIAQRELLETAPQLRDAGKLPCKRRTLAVQGAGENHPGARRTPCRNLHKLPNATESRIAAASAPCPPGRGSDGAFW